MPKLNFTNVVLFFFSLYVLNSVYVFYVLFNPPRCVGDERKCLRSKYDIGKDSSQKYQVRIGFSSLITTLIDIII